MSGARTTTRRRTTGEDGEQLRALRCFVGQRVERQDPLERRDAARAELGARGLAELRERLVERPCGAVDARRQHRVERVGDVDDAGAERDLLAPQPVGVARAVEALVVVADRRDRVAEESEPVDDAGALVGVALHQRPLLLRQARGLQQDRVRNRELADVVEERRVAEQVELGVREAELAADRQRELLDAARVARGVRVACVDGRREALHRRRRALLQQPVRLLERDVLRVDRLGGLAELLGAPARVREVRLLRLAHQQQRHREDRQSVEPGRGVADRDHAADEAVDDVVRREPEEALVPDAPDVLASLDGERDDSRPVLTAKYDRAGDEAGSDGDELAPAAVEPEHEDRRRRERRERERADVEEHAVDLLPLRAPLDDADRHGDGERAHVDRRARRRRARRRR